MKQQPRFTTRSLAAIAATIALVLVVPALALAHAVVYPRASTPGAYERYVLRVPNEKNVATTKVELHFPTDVRVTGFEDVPGWNLEVVRDSAKAIVAAIWTGNLPPERFVEFPFIAVNPKTNTKIQWPAYQTYEGNQVVEWTGAEGSKTPASVTSIAAAPSSVGGGSTFYIAISALVLSIVSLGLAIRKPSH
ncbi:MAG TPA: YcnI family protein [Gemmatimonadaceae bacterium]|jgi:uncharacterized protein YcnI